MNDGDNNNDKHPNTGRFSTSQILLIFVSLAVAGLLLYRAFAAAPTTKSNASNKNTQSNQSDPEALTKLYLVPASQKLSSDAQITVEVREDSGATPVNAIQADFSYPADKLTYLNTDYTGSGFDVKAQEKIGDGQIVIARGSVDSRTGDQLIAKVNFKAASGPTTAELKFQNSSAVIGSASHKNTLSSDGLKNAVYVIE